jgi:hypothetical protein
MQNQAEAKHEPQTFPTPREPASPVLTGKGTKGSSRGSGRPLPRADRLAHRDVEPVPDVDIGDRENQRRELLLVKMLVGLVPDRIRHPIGAVAEPEVVAIADAERLGRFDLTVLT